MYYCNVDKPVREMETVPDFLMVYGKIPVYKMVSAIEMTFCNDISGKCVLVSGDGFHLLSTGRPRFNKDRSGSGQGEGDS